MNISKDLQQLVGTNCWRALGGVGSILLLGFGDKIKRLKPIQNKNLREVERLYEAEFTLMFDCTWRICDQHSVICSWRDSLEAFIKDELDKLDGKRVQSVEVTPISRDLTIRFSDGVAFEAFCDVTNDNDGDSNYDFIDRKWIYDVGLKSVVSRTLKQSKLTLVSA